MSRPFNICSVAMAAGVGAVLTLASATPSQAAWEPTRPVEFVIPAGTGGGADIMARTIPGIVTKHNLMKQPMVVIDKAGGPGGEGFLDVKSSANESPQDHHHPVEPVHDADRYGDSLQLERSQPGRHARAR